MDSEILSWLRRVWDSPFDVAYGIYYGYPLCCIAHYVLDNFLNLASANERGGVKMPWKPEESYVPCVLCKRRRLRRYMNNSAFTLERSPMEVKSAMLRTWSDERAVLTLVDESYEIHSISGSVEVMRFLLQDVELPNFKWVHSSDGRSYYAQGHEYKGRYDGGFSLKILEQYRKKDSAA